MTHGVYEHVLRELGSRRPEAAGLLLGPRQDEPLATHFVLDTSGLATPMSFTLDAEFLNEVLERFRQCDMTCVGIVHSHPGGFNTPSHGDREYLLNLFGRSANQGLEVLLFPIFAGGRLHPYLVRPGCGLPEVEPAVLVLV